MQQLLDDFYDVGLGVSYSTSLDPLSEGSGIIEDSIVYNHGMEKYC